MGTRETANGHQEDGDGGAGPGPRPMMVLEVGVAPGV